MQPLDALLLVGAVAPPLNAMREGNNFVLFTPFVSGSVFAAMYFARPEYVFVAQVLSVVLAILYYGIEPVKLTYKEEDLVRRVTTILPPRSTMPEVCLWAALHAQHIGPAVLMFTQFERPKHVGLAWPLVVGATYVLAHEAIEMIHGHPAYPLLRRSRIDKVIFYVWCAVLTTGATIAVVVV